MKKHGPNNERIKRKCFAFLKEAKRHSEPKVDAPRKPDGYADGKCLIAKSPFPKYGLHLAKSDGNFCTEKQMAICNSVPL